MISKSINKNYSVNEQRIKLEYKFNNKDIKSLNIGNLEIKFLKINDRFYYKEIISYEFQNILNFFKKEDCLILSMSLVKNLIENGVLSKEQKIYQIHNKSIFNPLDNIEFKINDKFIIKDSKQHELLDSSIFSAFLINKKTSNNFSYLIIYKDFNISLIKRKSLLSIGIVDTS